MSLARVKVWIPGDVLTAADLNSEFNNVLNNPNSLISPSTGPINFNLQAHTGLLPSVITGTSGVAGNVLTLSTAATPVAAWSGSAMQGSKVRGLTGTLSSQIGTFSADQYAMQSTNLVQSWTVNATSSFDVSIGTAGPAAGGRDQSGSFASTYVHWYAISTGPGSTAPSGIVSSNPPNVGPAALPSGYTGWTYLGCSAYSSSSTTLNGPHRFRGALAEYDVRVSVLSGGTSTSVATVSNATNIPLTALAYSLEGSIAVGYNAGADATQVLELYNTTSGALASPTSASVLVTLGLGAGHTFGGPVSPVYMVQTTKQNFGYAFNNSSTGSISSVSASLSLGQYLMANGGE